MNPYLARAALMNSWDGLVISIVGPIGVGKSALLKLLAKDAALQRSLRQILGREDLRVAFLTENVTEWETPRDGAPGGMLKYFYDNPKQHGFTFQLYVFDQHVKSFWALVERERPDVVICERGMICQKIFADELGLSPIDQMVYDSQWSRWVSLVPSPNLVIRMETTSEHHLMARVRHRAREGELKPMRRSASGMFIGGDDHAPREAERPQLTFSMDGCTSPRALSGEEDEEDNGARTEDGAGVTLEYQRRLISGHRKAYPLGVSSPYGLPIFVKTVVMDADPPYHEDRQSFKELLVWMSNQIANASVARN